MPEVVIEVSDNIVGQTSNTVLSRNSTLQDTLIRDANSTAAERVMQYIHALDDYNCGEGEPSWVNSCLFDYAIYDKFEKYDDALHILLEYI